MKRLFTICTLLLLIAATTFAGPISPQKAQEIASSFWKKIAPQKSELRMQPAPRSGRSTNRTSDTSENQNYYIFTEENSKGFIIISGDDELSPIVGYSTTETRTDEQMPEPLIEWLEMYDQYVDAVRAGKAAPLQRSTGKRIEPLLKTTWDQGSPYNKLCPKVGTQTTPTGCTTTAVAQVMKYHSWPQKPKRSITWESNITGEKEYIDITKHTYNWDNMLNSYKGIYSNENATEVAQLMVDVGKAIKSSYALEGTGAHTSSAIYALVNIFDYSSQARVYKRSEHTNELWMDVLRDNLEARRPILYFGYNFQNTSGHAFVCDGIDENDMLHINWGWGGSYDGFFDMAYMQPSGVGTGGGTGQYSVGQTIIANVYPHESSETGRQGDPTLYMFTPMEMTSETFLDSYETTISSLGQAKFRVAGFFINWSHTAFSLNFAGALTNEQGDTHLYEFSGDKFRLSVEDGGGLIFPFTINKKDVPAGKYKLQLLYKQGTSDYQVIPGANNGISVEVTDKKVKVSNLNPRPALSQITFSPEPAYVGDILNFEAKIVNKSEDNRLILVVPVLNTQNSDGSWTSEPQTSNSKLIDVLDEQEIALPFTTNIRFNKSGKYFISFAYNVKNYYTDANTTFDTNKMFYVEGTSDTLDIKELPDGALPTVISYTVKDINNGANTNIKIRLSNSSSNGEAYTGTIGIFLRSVQGDKDYLLNTQYVKNLKSKSYTNLNCATNDYLPLLGPGRYMIIVREFKDGQWQQVRQTVETSYFSILESSTARPYVCAPMVINDGKVVVQGDEFKVKVKLDYTKGSHNGYIKVNTAYGTTTFVESDPIAVNIEQGKPVELEIPCRCIATAPLGKWHLSLKYYSLGNMLLGNVSNNTPTYPENGIFWIGDKTEISTPDGSSASVSVSAERINISGVEDNATIMVFSIDGRLVYQGNNTTINVAPGQYIINVISATGCDTFKVIVR